MGMRRKARELALAVIFEQDFNHLSVGQIGDRIITEMSSDTETVNFLQKLLDTYSEHVKGIDTTIETFSNNWKLSRMASVDRNILRLGVCEILFCDDIPKSVTINEYLEIAKKYGTEESSSFINGILDKVEKK